MSFGYSEKYEGHKESVLYVKFLSSHHLISASLDGELLFWDLLTKKTIKKIKIPRFTSQEICIYLVIDDSLYVGHSEGLIASCGLESGALIFTLKGHSDQISGLAFNENSLFSSSQDCSIRSWSLKTGSCEVIYQFSDPVSDIFIQNSHLFLSSWDKMVRAINIQEGSIVLEFLAGEKPLRSLFVDENLVFSGGCDLVIKSFDMISSKTCEFKGIRSWVMGLTVFEEFLVAFCDDKMISVWNKSNCKLVEQFSGHLDGVTCLEIGPEIMVSGGFDHLVLTWDVVEMKTRIAERGNMTRNDIESRRIETYFRALNSKKKGKKNKKGKKSKKK
jgi:WD40 repeat protein